MEADNQGTERSARAEISKEAQECTPNLPALKTQDKEEARELNSANYYESMRQLIYNSRHDRRLTPATQLVYRVLADFCNANYWATTFEVTNAELKEVTHINSNEEITRIKRSLKNLGYIDFSGKPSKYTIYRPPVKRAVQGAVHREPPRPPYKTYKQQNYLKKKDKKEERGGGYDRDDLDWLNDEELNELL